MIVVEQMALADAAEQLALQRKAFLPPYARYRDEGSPIFTPESEMIRRIEDPCGVSLKILVDGIAAGGHLHRSGFPMPWSRSNAFGTARKGATGYPALVAQSSQEEAVNRHIYEKMGYQNTGRESVINVA